MTAEVIQIHNTNRALECAVVKLTPALAKEYLDSNDGLKRNLTLHRVDLYAAEIRAGNFILNGQPIIFNRSGEMVDGQTRCSAVIQAKKAIPAILVVKGVDDSAYVAMDSGKARSAGDVLAIAGYKNVHYLAAAARVVICFERHGELHQPTKWGMSSADILARVESDDRIQATTRFYNNLTAWTRMINVGASLPGLHIILRDRRVALGQIEEFADDLIYGEKLKKSDPIYQFRTAMIASVQSPTHRMQTRVRDARLIKTWNAWFTGNVGPGCTEWHGLRDEYPKLITRLPK